MENPTYIIGEKNGKCITATAEEIIKNAQEQQAAGIAPHYSFWNYKDQKAVTPKGWLVWNSYTRGCGIVFRRPYDGKWIICTGMPGDYAYI